MGASEMGMQECLTILSPFALIGGESAVDRLVEAFYRCMETLPEGRAIRAIHPADLSQTKSVLKAYLGEWLGGPPSYSSAKGHPRLRMRHLPFKIGIAERDAWLACMNMAMDEVVSDSNLRGRLMAALSKTADWVRNDQENPHDRHP